MTQRQSQNAIMLALTGYLREKEQKNIRYSILSIKLREFHELIMNLILDLFLFVDVSAAAGHGYFNSDYTETLGEINLPTALLQSKYGNYYYGIVNGESMAPTLLNQDYIIFRLLTPDEWIDMKDGKVYFIVDRSGSSFVKRIKNNLKSEGNIICMSDSIDKANFRDLTLFGVFF